MPQRKKPAPARSKRDSRNSPQSNTKRSTYEKYDRSGSNRATKGASKSDTKSSRGKIGEGRGFKKRYEDEGYGSDRYDDVRNSDRRYNERRFDRKRNDDERFESKRETGFDKPKKRSLAPQKKDSTGFLTTRKPKARPKFRRKGKAASAKPLGDGLVRLNRFLSMSGETSRRKADEMISQGEVTVNGKVVTELGTKVNPETDRVEHLGKVLKPSRQKIYIVMNKPKDTITSLADEKSRTTVIDLLGIEERVYPVGRLDRNTMGVLLLTNDGDLAAKLMHPSSEIKKEYLAELDSKFTREGVQAFKAGMRLKDTGEKVAPAEAMILGDGYTVRVVIHEGKNRQIHRMFYNVGYDVKKLERVSYAGITAAGLRRGAWRLLTVQELNTLRKKAGLVSELKKLD